MNETKKDNKKKIWLLVVLLLIGVCITGKIIFDYFNGFLLDDTGSIPLTPPDSEKDDSNLQDDQNNDDNNTQDENSTNTVYYIHPGFEASDENVVWGSDTKISIFKISYENGEKVVTVNSDNGDKLIAPGTENSYTFKLKNTGDVALDYSVNFDAYVSDDTITLPVVSRINRYDAKWIIGNKDDYVDVEMLDKAEDTATLGAGKYTYYTLDWKWLFENGTDDIDTMLGNLAVDEDIVLTIKISTTATLSADAENQNGILPPYTGDSTNAKYWLYLSVGTLFVIFFLVLFKKEEEEENNK